MLGSERVERSPSLPRSSSEAVVTSPLAILRSTRRMTVGKGQMKLLVNDERRCHDRPNYPLLPERVLGKSETTKEKGKLVRKELHRRAQSPATH